MNTFLNKLRGWLARRGSQLFSQPYLPGRMTVYVLALALADLVVILLRQSAAYWSSYSLAENELLFVQGLLAAHPLALIGAGLVYLVAVWAITALPTRGLALAAWLALVVVHSSRLADQLTRWLGLDATLSLGLLVGLALLGGAAVTLFLLRPPRVRAVKPAEEAGAATQDGTPRFQFGPARLWKKIPRRVGALVGIGLVALLVSGSLWWLSAASTGWKLLKPAHSPGPRARAAVAYDAQRQQIIYFGGGSQWLGTNYEMMNDTWTWTGSDWQEIKTETAPTPRISTAMAFDEQRGVIVLFGGEGVRGFLNDTWEWDGQTWKQIFPREDAAVPRARSAHQLFYDLARQKVVLSGGYTQDDKKQAVFLDDAWEWDGQAWQPVVAQNNSPQLAGFSVARDPNSGSMLAIGYPGAFTWAEDHWSVLNLTPAPSGRTDFAMVNAGERDVVLFGGGHDDARFQDTWLLHDGTWKEIPSMQKPAQRILHSMFYDPISKRVILHGGYGVNQVLGDTWALDLP